MTIKTYVIDFKLVDLPAGHYWQSAEVEGSNLEQAIKKAWRIVKNRPHVKGKRIRKGSISFEVVG